MSTTTTRPSTSARLSALEAQQTEILKALEALTATLTGAQPAKARTRKAQPKAAPKPVKVTKGAQTRETLSRKDWNRTLTTKARLAGGDTYKRVLAQWDRAQELRNSGKTPDEALAQIAR